MERSPFSDDFVQTAYQFSHGVARRLNRVCLNGPLLAFAERKTVLDGNDARSAIAELDRSAQALTTSQKGASRPPLCLSPCPLFSADA